MPTYRRHTLVKYAKASIKYMDEHGSAPAQFVEVIYDDVIEHAKLMRESEPEDSPIHQVDFTQADDIQILNWILEYF